MVSQSSPRFPETSYTERCQQVDLLDNVFSTLTYGYFPHPLDLSGPTSIDDMMHRLGEVMGYGRGLPVDCSGPIFSYITFQMRRCHSPCDSHALHSPVGASRVLNRDDCDDSIDSSGPIALRWRTFLTRGCRILCDSHALR